MRNYALGAQADQSSTYEGDVTIPISTPFTRHMKFVAELAIDHRNDARFEQLSVSQTLPQTNPWWRANLTNAPIIKRVRVWKRQESHACTNSAGQTETCDRLDNWSVFVSTAALGDLSLAGLRSNSAVREFHFSAPPAGNYQEITLPDGTSVQQVVVMRLGSNVVLNLAEVEIFGADSDVLPGIAPALQAFDKANGAFMHWGPGTWSQAGWNLNFSRDLVAILPSDVSNNVGSWGSKFVDMGVDYAVLVAKHHDGFANFETAYSDYKITNTPNCRNLARPADCDVVAAYVQQARAAKIKVGLYFSIWDRQFAKTTANYQRNDEYIVKLQLRELLTHYGVIDILWFDGFGWNINETSDINWVNLREWIKQVSPTTVVMNNDHRHDPQTSDLDSYELGAYGVGAELGTNKPDSVIGLRIKEVSDTIATGSNWFYVNDEQGKPLWEILSRDQQILSYPKTAMNLNLGPDQHLNFPISTYQRMVQRHMALVQPELIAINTPGYDNIAGGKTSSQSSTLVNSQGGASAAAVDGLRDGNFTHGSVSHTQSESNPWWQVDLGSHGSIDKIVISNRSDCCKERLATLLVAVTANPITGAIPTLAQLQAAGDWGQVVNANGASTVNLTATGASGRYVRVYLQGTGVLSLAEVEVLRRRPTNLSLNPNAASQSSTYANSAQFAAANALNGSNNLYIGTNGLAAHTAAETEPWWQIDLGSQKAVNSVRVWNRGPEVCDGIAGSCPSRLTDFYLAFSAQDLGNATLASIRTSGNATLIHLPAQARFPSVIEVRKYLSQAEVSARYVRIINAPRVDGAKQYLALMQVEVDGFVANVASGATATQSSTITGYPYGAASLAIDGNTEGNYNLSSVSHTAVEASPWLKVTLPSAKRIDQILLYNRSDCCAVRLSNFDVELYDAQGLLLMSLPVRQATGSAVYNLPTQLSAAVKEVKIQSRLNDALSIAEILLLQK